MGATPAWRRPYLRPDASWSCGRGGGCPLGPSPRGACRGTTTCQPQRTWLGLRRRLCLGALAATLALFALIGASPDLREGALDPGPLTPAHAALARECADCHAAAEQGALGLLRQAWTRLRSGDATHADDRRCLECHDQGPHALEPHGLDPARLALARVTTASPTLLQRGARAVFSAEPAVSCAECHVEKHRAWRTHPHSRMNLDASAEMLEVCRSKHGPGLEVVGDLLEPPLAQRPDACVLSLRLMQHYHRAERVAALRAFRGIANRAVVAYYPGWDWKNRFRRLRARLGLPVRKLREAIPAAQLHEEAREAGWNLVRAQRVFPILSENVLLHLHAS